MRHHQGDAGRGLGGSGIEARDPAARDRRMHDGGMQQALHRDLGGKARGAAHFQRAVDPRHRLADMAVLDARSFRPRTLGRVPGTRASGTWRSTVRRMPVMLMRGLPPAVRRAG